VNALEGFIRTTPDFPEPGIAFRDITPLLADAGALNEAVAGMATQARGLGADIVIGAEARGFLLGPALGRELGCGFVMARKPGKLPYATLSAAYSLEYGAEILELHNDAISEGHRVLVHDDLLATGGTAQAVRELVEKSGGEVVGFSFLIELEGLGGRERLSPLPVESLMKLEGT
jgi:adenine phosphoribosyltransferase